MEFALPAQLKGPECRKVITEAIAIRKALEPWFGSVAFTSISKFTIVLRVDGSLGSFGPEGIENIQINNGELECDLVISDRGWTEMADQEIASVLGACIFETITTCFDEYRIQSNQKELAAILRAGN